MTREVTSKHIGGIADLVVFAPIKEGFIDAYENVTYQTRLRLVAEALHGVRVAAREYEKLTPFSDTVERILTLLNFRIGILDKDLYEMTEKKDALTPRRYLYLSVAFDGALEPYMRLIWRPLGIFLDLLFCNCEGYKPAGDNGFPDYFEWVRKSQVDSAMFYSTTGLTVRDQIYLRDLERIQRAETDPVKADLDLCRMTMADPEDAAALDRSGDNEMKAHGLALEALNVLYRLADYYPPDRLDPTDKTGLQFNYSPERVARALQTGEILDPPYGKPSNYTYAEGRYLLRAARSLLLGWDSRRVPIPLRDAYKEQLDWYEWPGDLGSQEPPVRNPVLVESEVQGGILTGPGTTDRPVRHGALLLMTVTSPTLARLFIKSLREKIHYEGAPPPQSGLYLTIAFTADGLKRFGLFEDKRARFPKEFREGMEKRSGLLGDFRENHPRNWILPERNWPAAPQHCHLRRPPVEMSEVDFVIQVRYAPPAGENSDDGLQREIERLAEEAEKSGVVLAAFEPMVSLYEASGQPSGHFKLRDGISQPHPRNDVRELDLRGRDDVRLGEILYGYRNDRGDQAPKRARRDKLKFNGSFLVIRKIEQKVQDYFDYLEVESARIAKHYGICFTADDLAARLLGRTPDGTPLVPPGGGLNDFDYSCDSTGDQCPHAAHIRRSNPRDSFQDRPSPRILRRGMSFGAPGAPQRQPRGVMFMAYNASIADQFEVIQRWINGGNSTGIAAANSDPLIGVRPAKENPVHRFVVDGKVIRTEIPKPFVKLHWGLYLFAPSRTGIDEIARFVGNVGDMKEPRELNGRDLIAEIENLEDKELRHNEWKRVLEDFDTKDPAERSRTPDIWSAIRWYKGGSYRVKDGSRLADMIAGPIAGPAPAGGVGAPAAAAAPKPRSIVLVASRDHVTQVLSNPCVFSVVIQEKRIKDTSGPIYVAMQPGATYTAESTATNKIMFKLDQPVGFETGYACAKGVLNKTIQGADALRRPAFKLELRRDFITPTLALMCAQWFGLPDGKIMAPGGWSWVDGPRLPRCPGDFLSPSRHAFYPEPEKAVERYARDHGPRIRQAGKDLVAEYRATGKMRGSLSKLMAEAIPNDDDLLARNIIGMMIGALPPVDGNLRGILYEWLTERTLWRHQAALRRESADRPADYAAADRALGKPISRAMCKRPAPDLLVREALGKFTLKAKGDPGAEDAEVEPKDLVIVSQVSAALESLRKGPKDGDPTIVFGGNRTAVPQTTGPFHACPAYKLMMGSMTGILAALLEVGQIKAMPSSLIVEISNWK
ncbi:MAG TPA: hypothetical protein VF759_09085 [Allosphingosinicella sp.]|jgi:deferrochelatase/peroxidase EfeB